MARKILLADDSVTAQNMGRKILTDAGYEVVTVNNGSAALKKIAEHKPDLIVLDVYMPGYSGLEVCQRIKDNRETARIPVLLTVGKLEPFKPEEARRAKADAFVVKPFEASELLAALTRLEDKIVPQAEPYKQGRFAKAVSEVESTGDAADKDEGWKARLRIPAGTPKARAIEPPEVDFTATQGKGFRDFKEDSGKKQGPNVPAPKSTFAPGSTFERTPPAGVPQDITPEEIAAIAAAAAQLKGSAAPVAEPAEPVSPDAHEVITNPEALGEAAPVTFASSPELQTEAQNMAAEPATEAQAGTTESEVVQATTAEPVPADAVSATEPVQPIEEPAGEAASVETQIEEAAPVEFSVAEDPSVSEVASPAPTEVAEPPAPEPQLAEPSAPPAAQAADDEVMAALQSLMPAAENNSAASIGGGKSEGAPGSLAAIVAEVDSSTLKARAAGPRWIAEEVALAPSEATASLEREMEQAYASVAAGQNLQASVEASTPESSVADAVGAVERPASESVQSEPVSAYAMAAGAAEAGASVAATLHESAVAHGENIQSIQESEMTAAVETSAPVSHASPALAVETPSEDSSEADGVVDHQSAGGTEDMVASWKNIRDSIASGAAKPAPAKEREEVASPPETEAAAEPAAPAVAEVRGPSASDPKAIASIVDSVLAELRPRIVEEIARKLADSRKE